MASRVTVRCEDREIDWQTLAIGSIFVRKALSGTLRVANNQHLINMIEIAHLRTRFQNHLDHPEAQHELDILSLVKKYRRWEATDPRDKIYALMGLSTTDMDMFDFHPDYTRSPEETYRQFARAVLRSYPRLDFFISPRGDPHSKSASSLKLKSWIPDWSQSSIQAEITPAAEVSHGLESHLCADRTFSATGSSNSSTDRPHISDLDILTVNGSIVDHIKELGDCFEVHSHDIPGSSVQDLGSGESQHYLECLHFALDLMSFLVKWEKFARADRSKTASPAEKSNHDILRQILMFEPAQSSTTAISPNRQATSQARRDELEALYRALTNATADEEIKQSTDHWRKDRSFAPTALLQAGFAAKLVRNPIAIWNLVSGLLYGKMYDWDVNISDDIPHATKLQNFHRRRLARTTSDLLALVPAETTPGDNVALLVGGSVPYIVRPVESDRKRWQLVGGAYVHGIMEGERWNPESCFPVEFE